ncbi:Cation channel sperm-associated protein 4 [Polyrhizophydium stewartii]|uniref:Cation channel sperm-associated protein 4 n=1 Tax=Polyrhizophydium stewartii TaxID=2732419 RepID=A0ABR4N603_9FUNG
MDRRGTVLVKGGLDVELVSAAFVVPGVTSTAIRVSTPQAPRRGSAVGDNFGLGASASPGVRQIRLPTDIPPPDAAPEGIVSSQDNTDSYNKNVTKAEQQTVNFNEVAETDNGELLETRVKCDLSSAVSEGDTFRVVMLGVVFVNAIFIAIQTDLELVVSVNFYTGINWFEHINHIFLGIYIMEIVFRLYNGLAKFWRNWWNIFDLALVIIQLTEPTNLVLSHIGILRLIRVVRPFKSHRTAPFLAGVQMVVQTIVDSAADMLNITVLLIIITYIWAVVGVSLFGTVDPLDFGTLGAAFYTLFVTLTPIGWMEVFDELDAAAIYFASFIVIGALVFMKIIVAVVVANLEEAYKMLSIQEKARHRRLKSIRAIATASEGSTRRVTNMPTRNHGVWKSQLPYELPNFDNVSKERLEKYLTVLSVIEENMAEYMRLKEELRKLQIELKQANQKHETPEIDDDAADAADADADADEFDEKDPDFHGDVLTRLMRQRKANDRRASTNAALRE